MENIEEQAMIKWLVDNSFHVRLLKREGKVYKGDRRVLSLHRYSTATEWIITDNDKLATPENLEAIIGFGR